MKNTAETVFSTVKRHKHTLHRMRQWKSTKLISTVISSESPLFAFFFKAKTSPHLEEHSSKSTINKPQNNMEKEKAKADKKKLLSFRLMPLWQHSCPQLSTNKCSSSISSSSRYCGRQLACSLATQKMRHGDAILIITIDWANRTADGRSWGNDQSRGKKSVLEQRKGMKASKWTLETT